MDRKEIWKIVDEEERKKIRKKFLKVMFFLVLSFLFGIGAISFASLSKLAYNGFLLGFAVSVVITWYYAVDVYRAICMVKTAYNLQGLARPAISLPIGLYRIIAQGESSNGNWAVLMKVGVVSLMYLCKIPYGFPEWKKEIVVRNDLFCFNELISPSQEDLLSLKQLINLDKEDDNK